MDGDLNFRGDVGYCFFPVYSVSQAYILFSYY